MKRFSLFFFLFAIPAWSHDLPSAQVCQAQDDVRQLHPLATFPLAEQPTSASLCGRKISRPFYGRILRGNSPQDFTRFSHKKNRKIVFFIDAIGVQNLVCQNDREKLLTIGYPDDYIQNLLVNKTQFKLIIFNGRGLIYPATWDSLLIMLRELYGNEDSLIVDKFERTLESIKSYYAENPPQVAYDIIMRRGGEMAEVRRFLHEQLNINEYFSGDGFTYTMSGKTEVREYFGLNQELPLADSQTQLFDLIIN